MNHRLLFVLATVGILATLGFAGTAAAAPDCGANTEGAHCTLSYSGCTASASARLSGDLLGTVPARSSAGC